MSRQVQVEWQKIRWSRHLQAVGDKSKNEKRKKDKIGTVRRNPYHLKNNLFANGISYKTY